MTLGEEFVSLNLTLEFTQNVNNKTSSLGEVRGDAAPVTSCGGGLKGSLNSNLEERGSGRECRRRMTSKLSAYFWGPDLVIG